MVLRTMWSGALLLVLAAGMSRADDGNAKPVAGVAPGVVDGPTARRLVAAGVKVVDVRTAAEFAAGHVPGALLIPYDEMSKRHAEIGPPSTPVLLYCRSGRRSDLAAQTLREKGFATIYDLQAWDRWVQSEPKK